jgi:hypothetical protein
MNNLCYATYMSNVLFTDDEQFRVEGVIFATGDNILTTA